MSRRAQTKKSSVFEEEFIFHPFASVDNELEFTSFVLGQHTHYVDDDGDDDE